MRRLARAIVGEAAADDVVQDAWLQLGDRHEQPGYLAAIVRSLSLRRLRSERRRRQREDTVTTDELPSTAEIAARSEIVRKLAAAVESLDEPYRRTVVLRYFDDLSSAEIARRWGVPAATVRAHLKRGLEQLRASLDRQGGGRERWLGALLPWVSPLPSTPLKASSALAVFVAMKAIFLAIAAVGVLASAWVLFFDTPSPTPPAATITDSGAVTPADGTAANTDDEVGNERELVVAGASAAKNRGEEPSSTAVIEARVVDTQRYALPRSWLTLVGAGKATSDAEGRIRLELDASRFERLATLYYTRELELRIGAPGHQTRRLRATVREGHTSLHLGDLVLESGGSVSGRIVNADGLGIEGAVVAFAKPTPGIDDEAVLARIGPPDLFVGLGQQTNPAVTGTSGPGGQFHLEGVPVGFGHAWARTATGLWTRSKPLGVRVGENVAGIELIVADTRDQTITGRITDPEGHALAGVELMLPSGQGYNTTKTNASGDFHIVCKDKDPCTIVIHSPMPEWRDQRHEDIAVGTHGLELAFEQAAWLTVTATDKDSVAIRNGNVSGVAATGSPNRTLPHSYAQLDADGVAQLRRPTKDLRVLVTAPGYRDRLVGPFQLDAFPTPLTVTLDRAPALTGHVQLPDGQPAAGARVSLHHAAGNKRNVTHQGWANDRESFVYHLLQQPAASVTADDNGDFRLPLPGFDARCEAAQKAPRNWGRQGYSNLKGDAWYVHAAVPGHATVTTGPHVFDPPNNAELDLALPTGGTLTGRLLLPPRLQPAGWMMHATDGLGETASAAVNVDGTFTLTHLHAGGWQVRAFEPGLRGPAKGGSLLTKRVPKPDVEIEAGKTTEYDYEARPRLNARLVGRVRVDGSPPGALVVNVITTSSSSATSRYQRTLDPDGGFELALQAGFTTTVSFYLPSDDDGLWISGKPTIAPGNNSWSIDLKTAHIEGVFAPGDGRKQQNGLTCTTRGDDWTAGASCPDKPGRFGPVRVIAGPAVLRGPPKNNVNRGPVLLEVDLAPGKVHDLGTLPR